MGAIRLTPHTAFSSKFVKAMRSRLVEAGLRIPPAANSDAPVSYDDISPPTPRCDLLGQKDIVRRRAGGYRLQCVPDTGLILPITARDRRRSFDRASDTMTGDEFFGDPAPAAARPLAVRPPTHRIAPRAVRTVRRMWRPPAMASSIAASSSASDLNIVLTPRRQSTQCDGGASIKSGGRSHKPFAARHHITTFVAVSYRLAEARSVKKRSGHRSGGTVANASKPRTSSSGASNTSASVHSHLASSPQTRPRPDSSPAARYCATSAPYARTEK